MGRDFTIRGYHITSAEAAEKILDEGFEQSRNTYDWLGRGVYFFQEAPDFALHWGASDRKVGQFADPVVLGADIHFQGFMDLLDWTWGQALHKTFDALDAANDAGFRHAQSLQKPMQFGVDERQGHWLDQYVIEATAKTAGLDGNEIRGVRSVFFEGQLIYPGSHIADRQHLQIAVRDTTAILDCWPE